MNDFKSKMVKKGLSQLDVHYQWIDKYRTEENEKFFERAFDYITCVINAPKKSIILDAGCGTCAHSIRLANRGFRVKAIDFSEGVLKEARKRVNTKKLEDKINIQRENILSLTFKNKSFSYILCWGVLMHIPDVAKAISELTRVLKPKGMLVISERNMHSLQSISLRKLKKLLRRKKESINRTPAGIEHWVTTSAGLLLTRETNIQWLIETFKHKGLIVKIHIANQFTELYTRVSFPLFKNFIHGFNNFWFKYIRIPYPAFGNLIILQKEKV